MVVQQYAGCTHLFAGLARSTRARAQQQQAFHKTMSSLLRAGVSHCGSGVMFIYDSMWIVWRRTWEPVMLAVLTTRIYVCMLDADY